MAHDPDALEAEKAPVAVSESPRSTPHPLLMLEEEAVETGKIDGFVQLHHHSMQHRDEAVPSCIRKAWDGSVGHASGRIQRYMERRVQRQPRSFAISTHGDDHSDDDNNNDGNFHDHPAPRGVVGKLKASGQSIASSTLFYGKNLTVLQRELLCGVAATLLMIPENVAFSYVANLDPILGLYATGFICIVVGAIGGVPATVAGAAGALAVVMPQLTGVDGAIGYLPYSERLEHLFVALILMGIFQLVFGLCGFSKFFAMIPRTSHIGFLNGLAIIMFVSQKTTFEKCRDPSMRFGECEAEKNLEWMVLSDPQLWTTLFTVFLTMAIMHFFPKVPKIGAMFPPTLAVAFIGVGFEFAINRPLLGYDVRTIGDTSPLSGGFPEFQWPKFTSVKDWGAVLSCAASLATIGIFESIMTLQAVVDLTKRDLTERACGKECVAQGIGNLLCGVFQAMGGCSMIGQSTGNILNGARFRLSAVFGGITMFGIIIFASPAIELVPVACLTGILFVIILHTFYWPSFQLLFHMKFTDSFAIVLVTCLAAGVNLAVAVIVGIIWEALVVGWESGKQMTSSCSTEVVPASLDPHGTPSALQSVRAKVYHLHGNLMFSSITRFRGEFLFDKDPHVVIIDFQHCPVKDFSAVAALKEVVVRYQEAEKTCVIRNMCVQSMDLIHHDIGWRTMENIHMTGSSGEDQIHMGHLHDHKEPTTPESGELSPVSTPVHQPYPASPSGSFITLQAQNPTTSAKSST